MNFKLEKKDINSKARAGVITTDHGKIETPIFMPVGTAATVKGVHQIELKEDTKAQIILGNTYHLYLRPSIDIINQAGGLHKFMNWEKPILTDSGGYQVYSLSERRKIKEEGATFSSHIDGSKHLFTPENVMDIQRTIGADIIMAFDECTPYPCEYKYAKNSMHMTHRWLKRCWERCDSTEPIYGYSQTLFEREGNAIGGLSVGEPDDEMYEMCEIVTDILPEDKPRYLMGVGTPLNLLENIALGIDMFDCVMPTRNARNGMLFTQKGTINIKNKKWENDFSVIDADGTSYVDSYYSKAYLRHLIISKEILGAQIASLHNLSFYIWLVNEAREKIIDGSFYDWKKIMIKQMSQKL
jgi:queuine tRNA-ribosyltransferase